VNSRYTEVISPSTEANHSELLFQAEIGTQVSDTLTDRVAHAFSSKLIAEPFTEETITRGVHPTFLEPSTSIPCSSKIRRSGANQEQVHSLLASLAMYCARYVRRSRLTWLQASRCGKILAVYLDKKGLADTGYCGLTTALARHIEQNGNRTMMHLHKRLGADHGRRFLPSMLVES